MSSGQPFRLRPKRRATVILAFLLAILGTLALTGCDLDRDHGGGNDSGGSHSGHSGGCH